MAGMVDGVNKVFLLKQTGGALNIEGFLSERALAARLLYSAGINWGNPEEHLRWIAAAAQEASESIRRDMEERPAEEEDDGA